MSRALQPGIAYLTAHLAVSARTAYRLLRDGAVRGIKVGRVWKVDPADIDRYIALHRVTTPAETAPSPTTRVYTPRDDGKPELSRAGAAHYL